MPLCHRELVKQHIIDLKERMEQMPSEQRFALKNAIKNIKRSASALDSAIFLADNIRAFYDGDFTTVPRDKSRQHSPKPNRNDLNRSNNEENVAEYNAKLANNPERQCVGTNQLGERCRNWAIPGGRVCKFHGGATRHVVDKARIRVQMASDRLMGKLIEMAFDDTRPSSVQLEAIKDSLNRAGLKPREQVEVGPLTAFETVFDDIVSERPDSFGTVDDSDYLAATGENDQIDFGLPDQPERRPGGERVRAGQPVTDRDYDRPRGPETREQRGPDRNYRDGYHVTGDDAIRMANAANAEIGALRALPPGRSGC